MMLMRWSMAAARAAGRRSARSLLSGSSASLRPYPTLAVVPFPASAGAICHRLAPFRGFASAPTVFELAEVLAAKETGTEDRAAAINSVKLPSVTDSDALTRDRQVLELVDSGALASLVELLKDSDAIADSALLVPAFLALIRLSPEPLVAQELVRLGAPGVFARFLRLDDPRLQAAACLALGNVALEPAAEAAVATDTVASAVLHAMSSPHEAIKRAAATCLADIAGSSRGRDLLCNAETISFLSELLLDDFSDAVHSATAFALGNILASHDIEAQDLLRETGGLAQLVLLLSPAFPEETSSSAAWAIHHGVRLNHASQNLLADAGGLALLVQHLSAATETLQTNALLALDSAVASHPENQARCQDGDDGSASVVETLKRIQRDEGDDLNASAKQALESLLDQLA